jgi:hypothetical protein
MACAQFWEGGHAYRGACTLLRLFPDRALGRGGAHGADYFFTGGERLELDPSQWRVTSEAIPVLRRVTDEYRQYKVGYVLIIGYDENASTAEMSYTRSKNRAEATREALIGLGVPAAALVTKPCAFSNPLGSAIGPEPMNRRVEFSYTDRVQQLVEADRQICPDVRAPATARAP